jgi:hypothetical protein
MKTPLTLLHNKYPIKAITFLLCRSLRASSVAVVLAATFACTASSSGQVLFSDTFTATNSEMNVYAGGGQSGSLTPLPIGYTFTGASWQTQISDNSALVYANANTGSFSLAHNFTDAQHLEINVDATRPQGTGWIKFGSSANANYNAAGGAAFVFDGAGNAYFFNGAANTGLIASGITAASHDIKIEMISSGNYDGTGTVDINVWLDSFQLDLNGGSAGNTYTIASGFSENYITFAQFSPGFQSWTVNDWDVAVVPEPSTYALLVLSAAGVAAHVARRRRLR